MTKRGCSTGDDGFEALVDGLLTSPSLQRLWDIKDRGMPVFAHTVDVTLLCLEAFQEWHDSFPTLNLPVVVVGSLLHDLSKVESNGKRRAPHSLIMSHNPTQAVAQAADLLEEVQHRRGSYFSPEELALLWHVIVSHHGPWGQVAPRTPEADMVFQCDYYSATHHRLAPVDANDIVPLLEQGYSFAAVGMQLGVSTSVIRQRLEEARHAERMAHWHDLLALWRQRGYLVTGSLERMRRLERARFLVRRARQVPECVLEPLGQIKESYILGGNRLG